MGKCPHKSRFHQRNVATDFIWNFNLNDRFGCFMFFENGRKSLIINGLWTFAFCWGWLKFWFFWGGFNGCLNFLG
jgi:hypothetical protein